MSFKSFLLASVCISAQGEFYVGLHYFKVKSEYAKEFIEAEKNYLKAVDIDQDLLDAKLNLAILYLKIKNLNKSEFFFNQILDKTKNFLVFYNFGLLQAEKNSPMDNPKTLAIFILLITCTDLQVRKSLLMQFVHLSTRLIHGIESSYLG